MEHRERQRRKVRYIAAGAVNTFVGVLSFPVFFYALPPLRAHYLILLTLSQAISVTSAFFVYKRFVFQTHGNSLAEFARFSLFYAGYFLFNLLALPVLVRLVGLNPVVSQVGISVGIIGVSYLWHNRVTFAPGGRDRRW